MYDRRAEVFSARILRILGPDLFEAEVDLGFDIKLRKKFKFGGVDADFVREMEEDQKRSVIEFLRSRIEGQRVVLRTTRRGEHFYTKVLYGPEETSISEEMFTQGMLKPYRKEAGGSNSVEDLP